MLELIEFLILGVGVGTFGALLGLGGGIILVPLFMMFMIAPHGTTFQNVQQVVGTSLFVVLCNSVSGTWAYIRQRRIFMRAAVPFAVATMPGAFLGGYISEWFSGPSFLLLFGISLMCLAAVMIFRASSKKPLKTVDEFDHRGDLKIPLGVVCSFFVGFLSSILGIGGGIIHVPMMTFVLGFPAQIAVATSTFALMVSALVGVASHAFLNHIVWGPAVMIGIGAVVGAQIGAKISSKSKPRMLVTLLSIVMVLLGCKFVWRGLAG